MKSFVIGAMGFIGSAYVRVLRAQGHDVVEINRANYADYIGQSCDILINANGNSKKYLSRENPKADFEQSVASVRNSLVDFSYGRYVFLSTGDVYPDCSSPEMTLESKPIDVADQSPYGFHKYLAEQCVQHAAEQWLIIRQGGFVGPGLRKNPVHDVLYGSKLWVHPDSCFQFIGTDISASLVMEMIGKGIKNQVINLTAKGTIPIREIMRMAGRSPTWDTDLAPMTYEMSVSVAEKFIALPTTTDCVSAFLHETLVATPRAIQMGT